MFPKTFMHKNFDLGKSVVGKGGVALTPEPSNTGHELSPPPSPTMSTESSSTGWWMGCLTPARHLHHFHKTPPVIYISRWAGRCTPGSCLLLSSAGPSEDSPSGLAVGSRDDLSAFPRFIVLSRSVDRRSRWWRWLSMALASKVSLGPAAAVGRAVRSTRSVRDGSLWTDHPNNLFIYNYTSSCENSKPRSNCEKDPQLGRHF